MDAKKIAATGLTMLVLDGIFLSFFGPKFIKMIENIQNSKVSVKYIPMIVTYIVLVFQLYYFIIKQNKSLLDAFLLGFTTYAIFDLTNFTLIKNYKLEILLIDSIWGGILYALTTYIVKILNI